jgi:hypothetical protein
MGIVNVHNLSLSEKYLGMPYDVGASVNGAFKYLQTEFGRGPRVD